MTELLIMQQLGILYQCFRKEGTILILLLQRTRATFSEAGGSSEKIVIWHSILYVWRLFYCKWSIFFLRTGDIEMSSLSAIVYKYIFANKSLKIISKQWIPDFYERILIIYSKIISKRIIYYAKSQFFQKNHQPQKK